MGRCAPMSTCTPRRILALLRAPSHSVPLPIARFPAALLARQGARGGVDLGNFASNGVAPPEPAARNIELRRAFLAQIRQTSPRVGVCIVGGSTAELSVDRIVEAGFARRWRRS